MRVELLEDRRVMAMLLTFGGDGTALSLTENGAAADNISISQAGTTLTIDLNGSKFDAASSKVAGLVYSDPADPGNSTDARVDLSAVSLSDLEILPGAKDDVVTVSADSANIGEVLIEGGADTDSTTISSLSVAGGLSVQSETINLEGGISTKLEQTFQDPVVLKADLTIDAVDQNVTFDHTIDGAFALAVSTDGNVFFKGAVGNAVALDSLTVNGAGTASIGADIKAQGTSMTFNVPIVLAADVALVDAGDVTFNKTVDGPFMLSVTTPAKTIFNDKVGSGMPLASLTTDGGGETDLNGSLVQTNDGQTYQDAVVLTADATLTSLNDGDISFGATVDGPFALSVNTGGKTVFSGKVGDAAPLTSVATDAGGETDLNGGLVQTKDAQSYMDPVVLGGDVQLRTLEGGDITFAKAIDSDSAATPRDLSVDTVDGGNFGKATFNGAIGGTPLRNFSVETGGPLLVSKNITTTESMTIEVVEQTVSDDDLTIGAAVVLTNDAANQGGDIRLRAGDDVTIENQASILADDQGEIAGDFGNNDAAGSFIQIPGAMGVVTAGSKFSFLGAAENDRFDIRVARLMGVNYFLDGDANDALPEQNVTDRATVSTGLPYSPVTKLNPPTATKQPVGDIFNFIDSDQLVENAYELDAAKLSRAKGPAFTYANVETLNISVGADKDVVAIRMPTAGPALPNVVNIDGGANPPMNLDQLIIEGTDGNDNITVNSIPAGNIPLGGVGGDGPFAVHGIEALHLNARNAPAGGMPLDVAVNNVDAIGLLEAQDGNQILVGGNQLDVVLNGQGQDALFGRGGRDFLFADLNNLRVKGDFADPDPSKQPGFDLVFEGGDFLSGGDGLDDVGVLLGADFEDGTIEIIAQNGAVLSVLAWLRAQFVSADLNTITNLFKLALDSYDLAGGMRDWEAPPAEDVDAEAPIGQNPQSEMDVNGDGEVAPIDVLLIINELNANGPRHVIAALAEGEGWRNFFDTSGDDFVSAFDALLIINFLNRRSIVLGEGESPVESGSADGDAPAEPTPGATIGAAELVPNLARPAEVEPQKPPVEAHWAAFSSLAAAPPVQPAATLPPATPQTDSHEEDWATPAVLDEDLLGVLLRTHAE